MLFALGAAALSASSLALAAPVTESFGTGLSGAASPSSLYDRSAPDIYEKKGGYWRNKLNPDNRRRNSETELSKRSEERIRKARAGACLDSTYTEDDINTLLQTGGAGTIVQLCPGATITTQGPIMFNAPNQELSTQGYPLVDRGILVVGGDE